MVILTWKRVGAVILIVFSIFNNWEYRKPNPDAGITAIGMKKQIKHMAWKECCEEKVLHNLVENCMLPHRVCVFNRVHGDVNVD